jgi:hypothetical protein
MMKRTMRPTGGCLSGRQVTGIVMAGFVGVVVLGDLGGVEVVLVPPTMTTMMRACGSWRKMMMMTTTMTMIMTMVVVVANSGRSRRRWGRDMSMVAVVVEEGGSRVMVMTMMVHQGVLASRYD